MSADTEILLYVKLENPVQFGSGSVTMVPFFRPPPERVAALPPLRELTLDGAILWIGVLSGIDREQIGKMQFPDWQALVLGIMSAIIMVTHDDGLAFEAPPSDARRH